MPSREVTILSIESIDKFHNWLLGRGRSPLTAKAYRTDLVSFLTAVGEEKIPMEEYEELAQGWLNLSRPTSAPKTTGRRLTSLRMYASWAGYAVLSDYVAPKPGRPVPHPIPEGLLGLVRMIAEAKNCEQSALVGLCGLAGLRISEARSITTDSFDFHRMTLTVRGKGDKTRTIPLSERAWEAMSSAWVRAYDKPDKKLISYSDRVARKAVTGMARRAELSRPVASHDLRATFATIAYGGTKDLRVVQELLGHATSTQTETYTGVSMDRMREAVKF